MNDLYFEGYTILRFPFSSKSYYHIQKFLFLSFARCICKREFDGFKDKL